MIIDGHKRGKLRLFQGGATIPKDSIHLVTPLGLSITGVDFNAYIFFLNVGISKIEWMLWQMNQIVLQICDVTKLKGFGEKEFFNFGKWCLENIMLKTKEHYRHSVL